MQTHTVSLIHAEGSFDLSEAWMGWIVRETKSSEGSVLPNNLAKKQPTAVMLNYFHSQK